MTYWVFGGNKIFNIIFFPINSFTLVLAVKVKEKKKRKFMLHY